MIVSGNKICKSFGSKDILQNISFNVNENDRVAIVGVNGAGKTTLLKIITKELEADSGQLAYAKDINIGFLSQLIELDESLTIYKTLENVFLDLIHLENKIKDVEKKIASANSPSQKLINEQARLFEEFEKQEGYQYKSRIRGVINGLDFAEDNRQISTLSGGQKRRVLLGRLLLQKPSLLILDEPTNHLDINSISWLEGYLKNYSGTIIIVSHDRYFLDKICHKIIEIENKNSWTYNGNYTDYSVQKEINREVEIKQYINQQREIKKQEEVIRVLRSFNREKSIKRAESREKLLSKMDVLARPEPLPDSMKMTLKPQIQSGNDVLTVTDLSKSFPDKELFTDLNFKIFREDKIALIGDNGIGKTTLFKIILNQLKKDNGNISYGTNVNIGYYDQEHSGLSEDNTIFQELHDAFPRLTNTEIRNTLAAFVFKQDDADKKISSLSGGEKGRISLAKIMLSKSNFLLLDEPTNHLDMFSKEILENAISAYEGTVIYISHDRYFINSTATKVFEMTSSGMYEYNGDYDYFIEKRKTFKDTKEVKEDSQAKLDWQENKNTQKIERKRKKDIENLEKKISTYEKDLIELDAEIAIYGKKNDVGKLQELFNKKEKLDLLLNEAMENWTKLNIDL
ncbi:MAG: ABC-F family ATP-binding cassette domain-containing protein [Lachnospirales bacterium]